MDTLGCGFEALEYPACTKLLGAVVPETVTPHGAKVPGTAYQLDPVMAAFNIGAMIRWLDFNDTWLAAEWGHPSDNLGGILATADWLSRRSQRQCAHHARRADGHDQGARNPGRDRAGELLQPGGARPRGAGEGRLHRGRGEHARLHLRAGRQCGLASLGGRPVAAHLPPRAEHGLAQELGGGRRHRARGAPGADRQDRRDGLPLGADGQDAGASTTCCSRASRSGSSAHSAAT